MDKGSSTYTGSLTMDDAGKVIGSVMAGSKRKKTKISAVVKWLSAIKNELRPRVLILFSDGIFDETEKLDETTCAKLRALIADYAGYVYAGPFSDEDGDVKGEPRLSATAVKAIFGPNTKVFDKDATGEVFDDLATTGAKGK